MLSATSSMLTADWAGSVVQWAQTPGSDLGSGHVPNDSLKTKDFSNRRSFKSVILLRSESLKTGGANIHELWILVRKIWTTLTGAMKTPFVISVQSIAYTTMLLVKALIRMETME